MTNRMPLAQRRQCESVRFDHGRVRYHGSWSWYGDQLRPDKARPAEVFLDAGKVGSELQAMARDAAVATSLALQYGAPLETLRGAMSRLDDGSAAGPLGKLLDTIAQQRAGEA